MAKKQQDQIVETRTEARQAEPGPSVLTVLVIGTGLAVLLLGVVWFVFFRTSPTVTVMLTTALLVARRPQRHIARLARLQFVPVAVLPSSLF